MGDLTVVQYYRLQCCKMFTFSCPISWQPEPLAYSNEEYTSFSDGASGGSGGLAPHKKSCPLGGAVASQGFS